MPELVIPAGTGVLETGGPLRDRERVILDPITEDPKNAPLEITGRDAGHGIYLVSHSYPPGERKRVWAGSPETIGERPVGAGLPSNRTIPFTVWVSEEEGIGAGTNLATNPKGAIDTTGWSVAGGISPAVSRVIFVKRSLLGIAIPYPPGASAETGLYFQSHADGARCWLPWPAVTGTPYTVSAWIYVDTLGGANNFSLDIRDSAGNVKASADDVVSAADEWQFLSVSYVATGTNPWRASLTQHGAGDAAAVITALLIEADTDVHPYYDGDTPGCFFTGARHNSTSQRRPPDGARFTGALNDLEQKLEKLAAEGGTLKRVLPSGDQVLFDVVDANGLGDWDKPFNQHRAEQTFQIVARPYARGTEVGLTDHVETAKPVAIGTDTIEQGSARSLGRLVIDDDEGKGRLYVVWGVQSRYYDPSAEAALYYQAEDRTPKNGATTGSLAGAAGGSVVKQTNLTNAWGTMLTTANPSTVADHQHVGSFRVIARIYLPAGNSGNVSLGLQWSIDDFDTWVTNDGITYKSNDSRQGGFALADLGIITIPPTIDGSGKWRGRFNAKSTVLGDQLHIDYYALIPIDEASGELNVGPPNLEVPTAFTSRDEFDQSTGGIDGKALPVGGVWHQTGVLSVGSEFWRILGGEAGVVMRALSASDADETSGVWLYDGGANKDLCCVQADVQQFFFPGEDYGDGTRNRLGVVARYVDTDNYIYAVIRPGVNGPADLRVYKEVGGTIKLLESGYEVGSNASLGNYWHTIRLYVDTDGRYYVWHGRGGVWDPATPRSQTAGYTAPSLDLIYAGQSNDLAPGGALATGHVGVFGSNRNIGAGGLRVANFFAFVPNEDAAIFPNSSMEVRSDQVRRQSSGAGRWVVKGEYAGDYCILPPSGRELRTLRTIVLASTGDPNYGSDGTIADTSFRIFLTPQFDVVPEPA